MSAIVVQALVFLVLIPPTTVLLHRAIGRDADRWDAVTTVHVQISLDTTEFETGLRRAAEAAAGFGAALQRALDAMAEVNRSITTAAPIERADLLRHAAAELGPGLRPDPITEETPVNDTFKPGDRVYVTDPALEQIREIMRRATGREPEPNHHGTVEEVWEGGHLLIHFDDGIGAPYPVGEVRHLAEVH